MSDPRNRLRPLLHSGVPYKVASAIDELIALDEPDLYDWVLQAAYVGDAAMSPPWLWKYDDNQEIRHPSLTGESALKVLARARTPAATELRAGLTKLCIELGFNRRDEAYMDVSMLGGLTEVTKLRLMPRNPENQWAWRDLLMQSGAKPLKGFASITGMASLEHLTIIGGAGVDLAALTELRHLDYVELVACQLDNQHCLGELSASRIVVSHCHGIDTIGRLSATTKTARFEMLPDLTEVSNLGGDNLETVEILGAPKLDTEPTASGNAELVYSKEPPAREGF